MTDRLGQNAIQSRSVSGIRQTSAPSGGAPLTGWHPGHYVNVGYISNVDPLTTVLARMTEVAANCAAVKGVMVTFYIGAIEGNKNDYTPGFARIDQLRSRAQELGLRLMISVWKAAISSATLVDNTTTFGRFPPYMIGEGVLVRNTAQNYVTMTLYTQAGMDRYIACWDALAERYDTDPYIEAAVTGETSTMKDVAGYSDAAAVTQWTRLCVRMAAAWTHTNKIVEFNSAFGSNDNQVRFYNEGIIANVCVHGDPDVRPDYFPSAYGGSAENNLGTFGQRIYQGLIGSAAYPAHDFRGEIGCAPEVQGLNLGGNHTPFTFPNTEILDFIYDVSKSSGYLKVHYLIWTYKTQIYNSPPDPSTNDVAWNNASYPKIRDYLDQDPVTDIPLVTAPPSLYGGNVDTS